MVEDLRLWIVRLESLKEGNIGRSFNHILRTIPEILCISDACETGMGGYFIIGNHTFAWRFKLPQELRGIFSINLLEFLACYWTVKMIVELRNDSRFLSVTNSTNTLFWMERTNIIQCSSHCTTKYLGLLESSGCKQTALMKKFI